MASVIPQSLIQSVLDGRCVAFVGAGFTADSVGSWVELLRRVADELGESAAPFRTLLTEPASSDRLEAAAQGMADLASPGRFIEAVQANCRRAAPRTEARLDKLARIPFASVVTTNFDGLLGRIATPVPHLAALVRERRGWIEALDWKSRAMTPRRHRLYELHGSLTQGPPESVVFTAQGYRQRLFGDPSYLALLRALFATRDVLFLGFSFTDAYIRLLRSEVLAHLQQQHAEGDPSAWAIMPNPGAPALLEYYRRHEGLQVVPYDNPAGSNHSGFDALLDALVDATSARTALARILASRRVVWCDDGRFVDEYGTEVLRSSCRSLEQFPTVEATLARLSSGPPVDAVMTQMGFNERVAEQLLEGIRVRGLRVPVIVFASGSYADQNKAQVLKMGAFDYVASWEALFERLRYLFAPGSETAFGLRVAPAASSV